MSALLHVRELAIAFETPKGPVRALDGVDLDLGTAQSLGIVGESGSGKSTLGLAIGRLLPLNSRREGGDLMIDGHSVFDLADADIRSLRRRDIGFVFQNPMTALNPTMRVGKQVARALGEGAGKSRVHALMGRVGLPEPTRVAKSFPHQLSGGMAQRVAIGMAIARDPRLLVCDEPTASLDTSIRDQILDLLLSLPSLIGASVIILSHDLRAIAKHCDAVAVMYGGRVVEYGTSRDVFDAPGHPYTRALMAAAPGAEESGGTLEPIPGFQPVQRERSEACAFEPRCHWAIDRCLGERPEARIVAGQTVLCHRAEEVAADTAVPPRSEVTA